jgi:ketosteroid isomerase-like protein
MNLGGCVSAILKSWLSYPHLPFAELVGRCTALASVIAFGRLHMGAFSIVEESLMRLSYVFCLLIAVLLSPVIAADDQSGKQEVEKIRAAFTESFNKQNGAGIAELFTKDGVLVNPGGPHTDIAQYYDGTFKAGIDHIDVMVKEVTKLDADNMIGLGEFTTSGKNASGAAIGGAGYWTATYVRDGGLWKVRMLTGFPKAPPPK